MRNKITGPNATGHVIKCDSCGKVLEGETPKLLTKLRDGRILVRQYCFEGNCPDARVKELVGARKCIWCGGAAAPQTWKLGGLGEPYCGEPCYSEAGKAMFAYEYRRGNI